VEEQFDIFVCRVCPIGHCALCGEDFGGFREDVEVLATAGVVNVHCKTHLWMEGTFCVRFGPELV
jgi:hypothetical protein